MQIFLTKLQAYNAMYKLLNDYYKKTKSDDIGGLLGDMLFLADNGTADPATWGEWKEAVLDKTELTKQEAFDGMIRFLQKYGDRISSSDTHSIIKELRSAKNCNDEEVPLVKQWNFYLKEALNDPEGTREYL